MKNYYSFNILNKFNAKTFFLAFTFLFTFYGYSQNSCDVDFEVVKNRDSKKAGESGTHYKFWITNKSNQSATYILKVENSTPDEIKKRGNKGIQNQVNLPSSIRAGIKKDLVKKKGLSFRDSSDNEFIISLESKERKMIIVKIEVPKGITIGSKNTSKVSLKSPKCENIELVKYVFTEIVEGE